MENIEKELGRFLLHIKPVKNNLNHDAIVWFIWLEIFIWFLLTTEINNENKNAIISAK